MEWTSSYHWQQHRICVSTKNLLNLHRLKKLPTSASKANSDEPKSTKSETHHNKLTEIRKRVEFCLKPRHAGFPGNEIADNKTLT